MDIQKTAELLTLLAVEYPAEKVIKQRAKLWATVLHDISYEEALDAMLQWVSSEHGRWFPRVGQLRAIVLDARSERIFASLPPVSGRSDDGEPGRLSVVSVGSVRFRTRIEQDDEGRVIWHAVCAANPEIELTGEGTGLVECYDTMMHEIKRAQRFLDGVYPPLSVPALRAMLREPVTHS